MVYDCELSDKMLQYYIKALANGKCVTDIDFFK